MSMVSPDMDIELSNISDVPFMLEYKIEGETKAVELPAQGALKVSVGKLDMLKVVVANLLVAPGKGMPASLKIGLGNR